MSQWILLSFFPSELGVPENPALLELETDISNGFGFSTIANVLSLGALVIGYQFSVS